MFLCFQIIVNFEFTASKSQNDFETLWSSRRSILQTAPMIPTTAMEAMEAVTFRRLVKFLEQCVGIVGHLHSWNLNEFESLVILAKTLSDCGGRPLLSRFFDTSCLEKDEKPLTLLVCTCYDLQNRQAFQPDVTILAFNVCLSF